MIFLHAGTAAHKKKAIIEELESHGVILENLKEEVKKDLDIFDLICHMAWDKPALTRRERAEQCQKTKLLYKIWRKSPNGD